MRFTPAFLEKLNSAVDLPALIGVYLSDLKHTGADTHTALCPFHSEKNGSFTVSPKKGFYHCFGCGAHGNGIGFLMEHNGLSFVDAVKELASFAGVALPVVDTPEKTEEQKKEASLYGKALSAMERAREIYAEKLAESAEARAYLSKRGMVQSTIDKYCIGYAPDKWDTLTGNKVGNFSAAALEAAGLTSKKDEESKHHYDKFRDRIMFPIYSAKERIIGFGGRGISEQTPKYLNSPETILFKKGDNLFGVKQAIESIYREKRLFVMEGYMDVAMSSQNGIENAVASLGTSVTETQMRKMFSMAERITFCMDGDDAGREAAWRAAENILHLADEKHVVDFMFMPDGQDPDDFVRSNGKEGFDELANQAVTLTDYVISMLIRSINLDNGESLAKFLGEANVMAEKIKSPIIKLTYQKSVAERAGISLDTMLAMLAKTAEPKSVAVAKVVPEVVAPVVPVAHIEVPAPSKAPLIQGNVISVAARMLALCLFKDKEIAASLEPAFIGSHLTGHDHEFLLPLLAYIKSNPTCTDESVLATLAFNPHIELFKTLQNASKLLGSGFEPSVEAKLIFDSFRKMDRVGKILAAAGQTAP